ncbi:MAG: hypothetical protein IMF19_01340 [Proteobacteria bacterium]|nr:hypothetical protein [Pseudomonadota bacterium]
MTKEKGRLSARGLDENVVQAFREFVSERYGKLHTVFGQELEKAMISYLDDNSAHTHKNKSEKKSLRKSPHDMKIELVEEHIQAAGLLSAINNGGSVRPNAVKAILSTSVGIDPRTVNNHFDAFCRRHELTVNSNDELARL